jgi:hypothetical protein
MVRGGLGAGVNYIGVAASAGLISTLLCGTTNSVVTYEAEGFKRQDVERGQKCRWR